MKALTASVTHGLCTGSRITCADNTGAKVFQIISVRGYKGHRRQKPRCGVGSLIRCRVDKGSEKVRHEMFTCIVIRQRKEYRRANGLRISFEDNAAVVVDGDKFEAKGTLIKGPVAKEAIERFPIIGKVASQVV